MGEPTNPPTASGVSQAVNSFLDALGQLTAVDWILIGSGIAILVVAWLNTIGQARLGTIDVEALDTDDKDKGTTGLTAMLRQELADVGLLPGASVPSGSPTASLVAAVQAAPVPQAAWLATLIALLPIPSSSTSFKVSGTLRSDGESSSPDGLAYRLSRSRPDRCAEVKTVWAENANQALKAGALSIYRAITRSAPAIYPEWARWHNDEALAAYREGLKAEFDTSVPANERYHSAKGHYTEARNRDPHNILPQLRLANTLELEAAAEQDKNERWSKRMSALKAYIGVRRRYPTIFEAGYRISFLLSLIDPEKLDDTTALEKELAGLDDDRPSAAYDTGSGWLVCSARQLVRDLVLRLRGLKPTPAMDNPDLVRRLRRLAARESKLARRRLGATWTVRHEARFRHRYEPAGRERRQLRRMLALQRMCLRARLNADDKRVRPLSDLAQLCWRGVVFWRYMAGRSRTAGWQAHYNAACFYALLPQTHEPNTPFGNARLLDRAFRHLAQAINDPASELECAYVKKDPDLKSLHEDRQRWRANVLDPLCGERTPAG